MDTDDPMALPTLVKHERSPSPRPTIDTQESKRQACERSGVVRALAEFPWRTCQNLGDVERLKIKERAVKLAEENCKRIRAVLESALAEIPNALDSTDAVMMGHGIINRWLVTHDTIRKAHENLQILVGVEGPTGAGKSSLLSALLRSELFPSGHESAATAVRGKVSWNFSDDPGQSFRAQVTFRKKCDVEADLESILTELNRHAALLAEEISDKNDDDDYTAQLHQDIVISKSMIDFETPKVRAVWGLEEHDLTPLAQECLEKQSYAAVIRRILETNPQALSFLINGSIEFSSSSAAKLSKKIKPYLDSSPSNHGGGFEFCVWPLVEEVHIYAKADILKSGITLVDLPGCGDATASRSKVAQNFSSKLDVRMVVSPAIRATDEKLGQELIQNGFDETRMKIRGKLDGNGFCVIISKMDDMNVDSYITGCDELCDDEEVKEKQGRLAQLNVEKNHLKSMHKDLKGNESRARTQKNEARVAYDRAMAKHSRKLKANPNHSDKSVQKALKFKDKQWDAYEKALQEIDRSHMRQIRLDKEELYLWNWLHHRTMQTRNRHVIGHIRSQLSAKQALSHDGDTTRQSTSGTSYVLPMFPVSTKAFSNLKPNQVADLGFPSERFTGIPAVEQWLHLATLVKREKHLDEMLDGYQHLMIMMRIYSQTSGQDGGFYFTKSEVEDAAAQTHTIFATMLGEELSTASAQIKTLNPLQNRAKAMARFTCDAKHIVGNWVYKDPASGDFRKLHWWTYGAIIGREGASYTHTRSPPIITYNWIHDLATPILKTISNDWDHKMNKQLLKIQQPIMDAFSKTWKEYLDQLERDISENVPSLEVSFNKMRMTLDADHLATRNRVRKVLHNLSRNASSCGEDAEEFLTEEMVPTFKAALRETGRGHFQRRQDIIAAKVKQDGESMGSAVLNRLAIGLEAKKAAVPRELRDIAYEAIQSVKEKMSCLLNNLVENKPVSPAMHAKKFALQKKIRGLVAVWDKDWCKEGEYDEHILDLDLSIPDAIPELVLEEDDDEEDDDSSEDKEAYYEDDEIA